jgi:hypothetical protein
MQFERLFKLIKFKKAYENFDVENLVDNARTHTSKLFDLNNLNKNVSIKPSFYDYIEFQDVDNTIKVIDCHFIDDNDGIKKSKGLLKIAKELNLIIESSESRDKRYSLPNLIVILSKHEAFKSISKLESLAEDYKVKIIFVRISLPVKPD